MKSLLRCQHVVRTALLLAGITALGGCTADVTAPRAPIASSPVIALPAVEGTACRYGGEYPFCQPAPPPEGMGVDPGTEPIYNDGGISEPTAPPDADQAFDKGPVAWGACILAIAGSTLSIYDVLEKFQTWHAAYLDEKGAYDLWQATVQNGADPVVQQLYRGEHPTIFS